MGKWRVRFAQRGTDGLHDEPRPGKPRTSTDEDVERVIVPGGDTLGRHTLVDAVDGGGDRDEPDRHQPHLAGLRAQATPDRGFKLSRDPQFIDKVRDIVALYLNPPEAAVVLCVDEKSQIQALERSAPVLPLMAGVPERRTHDYRRNGTTNLYAALDVASGHVIADMTARHRAEEFRKFLNLIDKTVPDHLEVHLVLDNSSTHKTPSIQRWLARHPRFTLHFAPTYSSWLNLVERWFAELTKWIKRGTHRSVREMVASIRTWTAGWNDNPSPSSGTRPPTRSSKASPPTASESTTQVTSLC